MKMEGTTYSNNLSNMANLKQIFSFQENFSGTMRQRLIVCTTMLVIGAFLNYAYSAIGGNSNGNMQDTQYLFSRQKTYHEDNNQTVLKKVSTKNNGTNLKSMLETLIEEKTKGDDPRLTQVLREHMLDPPSHKQWKMSYPLFKTPQADAVDEILKNKVSFFLHICFLFKDASG